MIEKRYSFFDRSVRAMVVKCMYCATSLFILYIVCLYNDKFFYLMSEIFVVMISYGSFMVGWSSQKYTNNNYISFIITSYFFISTLNIIHVILSFGVDIFIYYSFYVDLFSIAARCVECTTWLAAFLFIGGKRRLRSCALFRVYALVTVVIVVSIFFGKMFPIRLAANAVMCVLVKKFNYAILSVMMLNILLMYVYRDMFSENIFRKIIWSFIAGSFYELSFVPTVNEYFLCNFVANCFKIISIFLVYKVIVEAAVDDPHRILSNSLLEKENFLLRAKTEAEAADRAKSTFLANMSHELRTPLNSILGHAQILSGNPGIGAEQLRALEAIRRSGRHLLDLINEILEMAGMEAGRMDIVAHPFSFKNFLQGLSRMFAAKAKEKGIDFTVFFSENLPQTIVADEKRLGQVLVHLLNNAVQFTDCGGVTFCVAVAGGGELRLRFEVRDTGVGVPGDKLQAVFEPFEQVRIPGRSSSGVGLGLAVSRNLLALMEEDLHVSSKVGVGSVFWFELTPERAAHDGGADAPPRCGRRSYKGPQRKILIVGGDVENRRELRSVLDFWGFEVFEAGDGEEALEKLIEAAPDLTLIDVFAPGLDGFDVIRKIRSDSKLRNCLVLAVAASVHLSEEAAKNDYGFDSLAFKPLNFDKLLSLIGNLLSLDWDESPPEFHAAGPVKPPPSPGFDAVNLLYDLAKVGDVSGLRDALGELEQSDNENAVAFTEAALLLLNDFKVKELREWLHRYREEANEA
jgi:signal transduction histidine kinase/ActR/RegA family two-component response regulator